MGMIACYMEVDTATLTNLKSLSADELFEKIEELEEDMNVSDIDKMWDGLHCLLTGVTAGEPIEGDSLSEAVVGVTKFTNTEDFITFIEAARVSEIAEAMNQFDIASAVSSFEPKSFAEKDIYPNIWLNEEKEDLEEEMTYAFESLKQLYQSAAEHKNAVVVSIY